MKATPFKPTVEQKKKMARLSVENPGLIEYAHQTGSFSIDKLDVDEMKNTALLAMHEQTEMQLNQIYEQVELLADQAKKIKERSDVSRRIHRAKLGFKPVMGHIYYLYRDKNYREKLSMISPKEWGKSHPEEFIAQVRLLADHTWELLDYSFDIQENS